MLQKYVKSVHMHTTEVFIQYIHIFTDLVSKYVYSLTISLNM